MLCQFFPSHELFRFVQADLQILALLEVSDRDHLADIVVDGMELRYSLFCRRFVSILVPADLELLLSLRQFFDVDPIVL